MSISLLEQATIIKGGAAIVIGNISDGRSWSHLLLNYLLIKAIENQKYQKIAVVCLDISKKEVLLLLSVAQVPQTRLHDRLLLFEKIHHFDNYYSNHSAKKDRHDEMAVFLFSLSELFISAPSDNSVFEKYIHLAISSTFEETDANELTVVGSNKTSDVGGNHVGIKSKMSLSLFTNVNCSLHSSSFLSFVKSRFPTVVSVVPNYGTLSNQVAAQVQTIRRSTATNKMSENLEMFSFSKNGVLVSPIISSLSASSQKPLIQTNNLLNQSNEDLLALNKSSTFTPTDTALPSDLSGPQRKSTSSGSPKPNVRLITFDSTDPEFDEDSDPDADLDL
jgi:hypothetical protein